jgi:2-C-methyl-D-erythritol 4-phosphate cytidylyltransferase / 2-C-methyl-D-erythritol 2,4-cyclodiphosphate synthase
VLAGIQFDEDRGLAWRSDGDVVTHALIDALLCAAVLGSVGSPFAEFDRG